MAADFTAMTGAYVQPGIGQAYPEFRESLKELYRTRVASLAFVPAGWLGQIVGAMGEDIVLLQDSLPYGVPYRGALPPWITSDPAAVKAWSEASKVILAAYRAYAAQRVAEGKRIVANAQANAAFWNGLYSAAVAIRDLPGNAVNAVGAGAVDALRSFIARVWWILALGLVGAFVWFNRGSIAKAANGKARKAVGL